MTDAGRGGELQGNLLLAAVLSRPLPGGASPVRLADLAFARDDDGAVRVVVDGMDSAGSERLVDEAARAGGPIRILAAAEDSSTQSGRVQAAVHVARPEKTAAGVRVRVSVSTWQSGREVPLESIVFEFVDADGEWTLSGSPTHSAG
ncbi:hypothetical protein [Microbacterium ulmi]|uniref:Uncharacterized protein n=1 Tax=Microbacterium ulmi TaxID=179095 RepID=A0A7Y2M0F2_9MICO|nr:hypothetical protein [Microbacterium ulmi]NII70657.1 hypothetical protein [Microbacterium ulmi]NNH04102.1 hypothetical protein [Microbacterium ulmi]